MSFISDVTAAIDALVATAGAAPGDLTKVTAQVEQLKKVLHDNADVLGNQHFQALSLTPSAFGTLPSAAELGDEHRLAHAVVADTIVGVQQDLEGFGAGVETFARGVDTADETTAADLQRRQAAVETLLSAAASRNAEQRNARARSEYLGGQEGA
jgi:hypothetical protein